MDLSDLLEIVGLCALLAAAFVFDWRLGLAVAGAASLAVGLMLDVGGEQ